MRAASVPLLRARRPAMHLISPEQETRQVRTRGFFAHCWAETRMESGDPSTGRPS